MKAFLISVIAIASLNSVSSFAAAASGGFRECGQSNDESTAMHHCIWNADGRCRKGAKAISKFSYSNEPVGVSCVDADGNPSTCTEIEFTVCATFVCE